MKKNIQIILLFLYVASMQAQQLQQNNDETKVEFKVKNLGVSVDGDFSEIAITSNFNKNNLQSSSILGIIKVNSIDTHNKKRNKHLLESDYFDAGKYPEIQLKSIKIEQQTGNMYIMKGDLSINGITKSIEISLEIIEKENTVVMKSEFEIDRSDFNVGGTSWILSDTVNINVVYTANK
jgi:polyisoprenoid-binding protein YceI